MGTYVCTAKLPQLGIGLGLVGTYELEHRSHNYINTFFPIVPNFNMMKTLTLSLVLVHAGLLFLFP